MRRARIVGAALAAVTAVLASLGTCGAWASPTGPSVASDASAAATPPGGAAPGLMLAPCRLTGLEHDALCGILRRPLDPLKPAGRAIDLHVAVIPALARQKRPDPVFFFAGGPGQSAIDLAGTIQRMVGRLGARRDLVLVDQRGTGRSAPLACDAPAPDEAIALAFDLGRMVAAIDACRASLERLPHGDLRQYTTVIASGDVEAVRAALGAERIDLIGVSYGTRAALDYLRQYPQHVRRVVLDAVAPPDLVLPLAMGRDNAAALDALFRDCAAAPACATAHPDLAGRWRALLASLPRAITAADPVDGRPLKVTLTADAAWSLVRPALYQPAIGAALPYAIEQAASGRFEPLLAVGSAMGGPGGLELAEGMHFSVVCAEDGPRLPPPTPADDGMLRLYREVCARWPRGELPAAFLQTPASPVPVLLLSGALDPVTPPPHAARVAKALGAKAVVRVIPNAGHGALSLACVRDAAVRFIDTVDDAAAMQVDLSCVSALPRPPAFSPPLPRRAQSAPVGPGAALRARASVPGGDSLVTAEAAR